MHLTSSGLMDVVDNGSLIQKRNENYIYLRLLGTKLEKVNIFLFIKHSHTNRLSNMHTHKLQVNTKKQLNIVHSADYNKTFNT
jgi:hypothetical protein